MQVKKLIKEVVDGQKPGAKPIYLWDEKLAGFGCKVTPSGRKVYICQYRAGGGGRKAPTRRVTIGVHGPVTADQARKKAMIILGEAADGKDPAAARSEYRKAHTLAELSDIYITACEQGMVITSSGRPKAKWTISMNKGLIARHIKPLLGSKRAVDLSGPDIELFMADVMAGKTATDEMMGNHGRARVTGGPQAASSSVALLGAMFSFAVKRGWRADNPCRGVQRPKPKERTRRLSPDEYRRLGEALDAASTPVPIAGAEAIRFLCLSGWRMREGTEVPKSAFDFGGSTAVLEQTKTGRSVRPLGRSALDVARAAIKEFNSDEWAFPGQRGGPYRALAAMFRTIAKKAKITGASAHTLRHSFASEAADLGYAESTIAALLGHKLGSMTSRYIHRADATLIAAANHVAGHIAAMMNGLAAQSGDVVELAEAKRRNAG